MPTAVPGVGECRICFEIVPSVKVLDCGHSLCSACAGKIIQSTGKNGQDVPRYLPCPECRTLTQCGPQGAGALKTRYFGVLKCDLCLEKKDADDCWWCGECVRTLCSKCSIKDHSNKRHTITEWNKLEPVKYAIDYIGQVKVARQGSAEAEHNRNMVKSFLMSLEDALYNELSSESELDRVHKDLVERYGTRFKQSSSSPNLHAINDKHESSSSSKDEGARVVAKVLQLAGANITDTSVPSLSDQKFQIHFDITPEEAAQYLRSKIQFIPFDNEPTCKMRPHTVPASSSAIRHSYNVMDRIKEEETYNDPAATVEEIFLPTSTAGRGEIMELDYDGHHLLALRYATGEVCAVNLNTKKALYTVPVQMKHECRSITFSHVQGQLYLALQSTAKRHEWTLECIDLCKSPVCIVFTTRFDIDPEDRVEQLVLNTARESGTIYEARICNRNVSEIWKGCLERKAKTPTKVKLKETMVYQKDEARITQLLVLPSQSGPKEQALFAWDDLSKSLYRLIIRDKRCYCSTKIATSPCFIPFSIDSANRLWMYDPCTNYLNVGIGSALNKGPITFRQTYRFVSNQIHRLWADMGNIVFAIHLASDWKSLKIIKCKKDTATTETASPFGECRGAAPIKRRSFSAKV